MRESNVIEEVRRFYQSWKFTSKDENPIRAELFAPEKLVEQAKLLAIAQKIDPGISPSSDLLKRFQANAAFLNEAHVSIADAVSGGDPIPPAEEWFLDNFHVIQDQLAGIKEDLPKKFYQELPALATGPLRGYSRVYEMALQLIAHTDSRLDTDTLREYIQSYQSVSTLTTGELWAIAILLRVGLIENLKRLIRVSDHERDARRDANLFANRLIAAASNEEIAAILKERRQDPRRIGGAFAVQLILRLRDTPPVHLSAVEWLYDQFSRTEIDASELIRHKHQDLAASQVSVSNLIQSLRLLATVDWSEIVEDVSAVHAVFAKDPSGHYLLCDFATRDRYRHVVEEIAKKSRTSETDIAESAIRLAENVRAEEVTNPHKRHIGYYLIDAGRNELENISRYRRGVTETVARAIRGYPGLFYQAPILLLTILLTLFVSLNSGTTNNPSLPLMLAIFAYLLPASALSVIITNWLLPLVWKPEILPKLELGQGIPEEYRTFVVLPSLLFNAAEVEDLVSRLEIIYLANNEDTLEFALLTDFPDSDVETTPSDEGLLIEAMNAIRRLNTKYPRAEGPRFHLYHRHRLWNQAEGKWMGWERKRGKLEEFNRLLLGRKETSYRSTDVPQGIKYVITLDSDTILPRDSARKLVGTITHH
jgi:cyclic beta-1,2-glucan synthetase